jgi:hypothetical protein
MSIGIPTVANCATVQSKTDKSSSQEILDNYISTISRHISNIFQEGELDKESYLQIMQIANSDRHISNCERTAFTIQLVSIYASNSDRYKREYHGTKRKIR